MIPYENPYKLSTDYSPTQMYAQAGSRGPQEGAVSYRSQQFDDGSMLLQPGEAVPPGYVVEHTFPDGRRAVVPAAGASGSGASGGDSGGGGSGGAAGAAGTGLGLYGLYQAAKPFFTSAGAGPAAAAAEVPAAASAFPAAASALPGAASSILPGAASAASSGVPLFSTAAPAYAAGGGAAAPVFDATAGFADSWGLGAGGAGEAIGPQSSYLSDALPVLGPVGMGLGAYGVYNAMQGHDREKSALSGGLAGAGFGAGAAGTLMAVGALNAWNPVGWAMMGAGGLAGAGLGGAFGRKKIKDYQAHRWGNLIEKSKYPDLMQSAAPGWINGVEDDHTFDNGPFAGKQWDEITKEDLIADNPLNGHLWLGNLETFGDEWHEIPIPLRAVITKRISDEGLYSSDKGDIIIFSEDQARAKEIKDEVLANPGAFTAEGDTYLQDWETRYAQEAEAQAAEQGGAAPAAGGETPGGEGIINRPSAASDAARPGGPMPVSPPIDTSEAATKIPKKSWSDLVASGEYRPGSAKAGGYVENATGKWVSGAKGVEKSTRQGGKWDELIKSGRFRKGSARAGGYVDSATGQWYSPEEKPPV